MSVNDWKNCEEKELDTGHMEYWNLLSISAVFLYSFIVNWIIIYNDIISSKTIQNLLMLLIDYLFTVFLIIKLLNVWIEFQNENKVTIFLF